MSTARINPAVAMAAVLLSDVQALRARVLDDSIRLRGLASGAILSAGHIHRLLLWRVWDTSKVTLPWVMLNPSTADATEDDPTIRRVCGFARDWGYGGIVVANLFTERATDPDHLSSDSAELNHEAADAVLATIAAHSGAVVCGWGVNGDLHGRASAVCRLMRGSGAALYCLGVNADGSPKHPLYQPKSASMVLLPERQPIDAPTTEVPR